MHRLPALFRQLLHYPKEHPLGYRVMQYVSACSFVFIMLATAVQLTFDYQREFRVLEQQIELIRDSYLASLAKSLWDINQAQIELQLQGIENLPDIASVQLYTPESSPPEILRNMRKQMQRFELIHTTASGQQRNLGVLDVHFDIQGLYNRIYAKGFTILLNQTLLVLLIVLVILIIFHRQITRHLEAMANYSRDIGAGELENSLRLNRQRPGSRDELDQLVSALNDMRQAIQQDRLRRDQEQQELRYNRDQLKTMVQQRTESLQAAKEAAEEANAAKTRFLSTISHEIRTPMNGMLGMIQVLENSELEDKQRRQVQVLHEATQTLLETFNQVLDYGRLVEGAHQASAKNFSLQDMLENLISLFTPVAREKQLTLQLSHPRQLSGNYCAPQANLRQILTNLLANAIKFTESGSVDLTVSLLTIHNDRHQLRLEVRDTGVGIPEHLQQRIFERFTQADETVTRRFGGTGLGLAICKELAEQLNASIGLHSQPGVGSTFWLELELPLASSNATVAHSQPEITSSAGMHILLVEDVVINQQVVTGLLADYDYRITLADNGEQALQLCQQHHFDLILMDMHLPGRSGLEISQQIRRTPELRHQQVRIIALTASVQPEDVQNYLSAGIDAVIAKPVSQQQLLQAIRQTGDPMHQPTQPANQQTDEILDQQVISMHRQMLGDARLTTLMQGFVSVCDDLWPKITKLLQEDNLYEAEQLTHKLAGACDTLGFAAASQQLRRLEQNLHEDNLQNLETLVSELQELILASRTTASEMTETQGS